MITSEKIRDFVENNPKLVTKKETSIPGVYLLKYKNRVFYDNLWNEVLQECRGTLVDKDYNVVSRPFTKIFNHGENGTTIDRDTWCSAFKKINGFMAAITKYNGELVVSTTGSTDSEFAIMAKEMLSKCHLMGMHSLLNNKNCTLIVEVVHPNDPHIIVEEPGVYLLGMRENEWHTQQNAFSTTTKEYYTHFSEYLGLKSCEAFDAIFSDICKMAKEAKHEGYVVYEYGGSDLSLKIKSPYYLMKKFLARKNEEKLSRLIDNPEEIKKIVDEEYYPVVDYICSIKDRYVSSNEQKRLEIIRNYYGMV